MKKLFLLPLVLLCMTGCMQRQPSSDQVQQAQAEKILQEGTAQTGMPAIKNFRERKTLKMIYELRDQEGLSTFTYVVAQQTGKPVFLCNSVGYAISDATGYLSPDKAVYLGANSGTQIMFQAEPNGLFTPDSSNANWVICLDTDGKPLPVFVSADVVVSAYRLP